MTPGALPSTMRGTLWNIELKNGLRGVRNKMACDLKEEKKKMQMKRGRIKLHQRVDHQEK